MIYGREGVPEKIPDLSRSANPQARAESCAATISARGFRDARQHIGERASSPERTAAPAMFGRRQMTTCTRPVRLTGVRAPRNKRRARERKRKRGVIDTRILLDTHPGAPVLAQEPRLSLDETTFTPRLVLSATVELLTRRRRE